MPVAELREILLPWETCRSKKTIWAERGDVLKGDRGDVLEILKCGNSGP